MLHPSICCYYNLAILVWKRKKNHPGTESTGSYGRTYLVGTNVKLCVQHKCKKRKGLRIILISFGVSIWVLFCVVFGFFVDSGVKWPDSVIRFFVVLSVVDCICILLRFFLGPPPLPPQSFSSYKSKRSYPANYFLSLFDIENKRGVWQAKDLIDTETTCSKMLWAWFLIVWNKKKSAAVRFS